MSKKLFEIAKSYIIKYNKNDNPYHNNEHMIEVFNNSMMLFNEYKIVYNLTEDDRLELGIAALFHDFNHSGGKLSDSQNIEIAINELLKFTKDNNINKHYYNIKEIILATKFPHEDIKLLNTQKIIRDADTMGGIIDGWENVIKSLSNEIGKDTKDFIPIQIGFLNSISFNTEYCNKILNENKESIIDELNKMV